ncbi:DUF6650 family protein [Achromobacter veterisilvae]|uniref:DUF6650 family protein n=1 Tax=Achromobacter veterisilvae TaxID=2069367 RepID=UPI00100EE231|nr:DUF6650 family protein [Achromobacter veterisilvae]
MKFERIYKNITGLGCPIFGIQWNAPTIEADEAQKIVTLLEDKRVLFNPIAMEGVSHCAQSVINIRSELTKALQNLPSDSNLAKQLRQLRKACQEFSGKLEAHQLILLDQPVQVSMLERALFKLRQKCGLSLAEIAVSYGLNVDDGLASIIPFNNPSNI